LEAAISSIGIKEDSIIDIVSIGINMTIGASILSALNL